MQRHGVTHTFLFPTALKAMMKACPHPRQQYRLRLQAIMSAGRGGGRRRVRLLPRRAGRGRQRDVRPDRDQLHRRQLRDERRRSQGVVAGRPAPGSMGGPTRATGRGDRRGGRECAVGVPGDVAVHRYDVHGTRIRSSSWATGRTRRHAAKFTGDWCRTGDLATRDADGYLWYQGRADDVFKAAGYRIGPGEIENCLVKHPAVVNAAVVPKPDAERGALVKAYVVLAAMAQN
jgi:acetyl-CoA synthetase